MFKCILTTSTLILGMAAAAPPIAQAEVMACGSRDDVTARLGQKYGEARRGGGLASETAIFEIWASEATGTWTILRTTVDGLSCIMAVGNGWQEDAGEALAAGSPV